MFSGASMTLWAMANVILTLRQAAAKVHSQQMKSAVKVTEMKLQELYKKTSKSIPVIVATVVDPRFKLDFFNWAITKIITGEEYDTEIKTRVQMIIAKIFTEYCQKRGTVAVKVSRDRGGKLIARGKRSTLFRSTPRRRIRRRAVNSLNTP
jgi:hypothetical protein